MQDELEADVLRSIVEREVKRILLNIDSAADGEVLSSEPTCDESCSEDGEPAIKDEWVYDTNEAAGFLGFQPTTLRNSRSTGRLAGTDPPRFFKMGNSVRYKGRILKQWRAQFASQLTTRNNEQ